MRLARLMFSHGRLGIAVAVLGPLALARAGVPPAAATAFIEKYCAGCHGDADPEANLDLTKFAYEPGDKANFALWVKVHDRVQAGEMPPKRRRGPRRRT